MSETGLKTGAYQSVVTRRIGTSPLKSTQKEPDKEQKSFQKEGESADCKDKASEPNLALLSVKLPGGVEGFINPKTGAKSFKI